MNQAENLGYAVNDLAGTITEISTAYAKALGYRAGDLIGRDFRDFIAPENREQAERCFARVLERGAGYLRAVYALPGGGRIAMDVSLMPVRTEDGRLVSVLVIPQAGTVALRVKRGSVHGLPPRSPSTRSVEPRCPTEDGWDAPELGSGLRRASRSRGARVRQAAAGAPMSL